METKDVELVDFVVTARKYKTLLTNKYKNRPIWHKPCAGEVISNLPGTIVDIEVKKGQEVKEGDLLLILEAMKMLNRVVSPVSGIVEDIYVQKGDKISKDHLMIKIDPK
ncbi:biotin carboxyl carrier protein [Parabacteroides sp. PF5-5]|uniref:biotin/lipoyl-containing protein n=1 Tax=unclassified Parabacteroides TaxID=2649774 RepID=UPI002477064D|nr:MULTISPECIES: biotin/lipoyl-containing protein [unclassified Parabacteroides]MDH6304081.1 biotin carboxyl carrier protein [Parabacteroides sp. PH5-39]MDH6315219.1 biotin carboxyl carrier protein [Parabacteroides sp. PF5-13]MDH6318864.1 biotin carboxyl carrier protein [Parabacteroides sp. PH5-13]MDH6322593.1 biotin carboxyl carrier protein [Parabacteroides sp. PH5-8]MDH6326255.1 biotin carboxyl carrier protein [Parabacteroides sp. PH5-41]